MALTAHEKRMIDVAWDTGQLTEKNWGLFLERLKNEPDRANAVQNALQMDGGKWRRGLEKRRDILSDPGQMGRLAEEFVDEHGGYAGAALEIGKQTITSIPSILGSAAKVATFQDLGEDPLGEWISAAQVIPYGRMALGLGGVGARAAGRGALASALGRAGTHRSVVYPSRVAEVADVVGSENPIIEAAGEGAFEVGSTVVGGAARGRGQRRATDKLLEGKRQLGNIGEVHPDTGEEVRGKRDREKSRRRRSYTFEQNGVPGRVDVERTGTANKQWKVTVSYGDQSTTAEYDRTEGIHSWETAFDSGLTQFVQEHPELFEVTPDETVEETVETPTDTTEVAGAETRTAEEEGETTPEVTETPETVEEETTIPDPPIEIPDLSGLSAPEQVATVENARERLRDWVKRHQGGTASPEVQAILDEMTARIDEIGDQIPVGHDTTDDEDVTIDDVTQSTTDPDTGITITRGGIAYDDDGNVVATQPYSDEVASTGEETTETDEDYDHNAYRQDQLRLGEAYFQSILEVDPNLTDIENKAEFGLKYTVPRVLENSAVAQEGIEELTQLRRRVYSDSETLDESQDKARGDLGTATLQAYDNYRAEQAAATLSEDEQEIVEFFHLPQDSPRAQEIARKYGPRYVSFTRPHNVVVNENAAGGFIGFHNIVDGKMYVIPDRTASTAQQSDQGFDLAFDAEGFARGSQYPNIRLIRPAVFRRESGRRILERKGEIELGEPVADTDQTTETAEDETEETTTTEEIQTDTTETDTVETATVEPSIVQEIVDSYNNPQQETRRDITQKYGVIRAGVINSMERRRQSQDMPAPDLRRDTAGQYEIFFIPNNDNLVLMPRINTTLNDNLYTPGGYSHYFDVPGFERGSSYPNLHVVRPALINKRTYELVKKGEISLAGAPRATIDTQEETDVDEFVEEQTDQIPDEVGSPTDTGEGTDTGQASPISANAPTPEGRLTFQLLERLREGQKTTIEELYELADAAWGGTRNEGTYSEPEAYNVLEVAGNLFILETIQENLEGDTLAPTAESAKAQAGAIRDFVESQLPRQDMRDTERDQFQQYSTPFSYAFAINWVADVRSDDVVLEPSAGTGNIAIYGRAVGAEVIVNELADRRAKLLEMMGFDPVFRQNAEQIDNILPPEIKPTVVVMNPPFSATAGRLSDQDRETGGRHLLHALRRLEPGGRLVAIVGGGINPEGRRKGGMRTDAKGYKRFWDEAHERASLRANIHVDGAVYSRFGTPFDTRVLVFDKPVEGETASKEGWLDRNVTSVEELIDALEEVRNARERAATTRSGETGEQPPPGEPTGRTPSERTTGTGAGTGDPSGGTEGADVSGRRNRSVQRRDRTVGGAGDTTTGAGDETVGTETGDGLSPDESGEPGGLDGSDTETAEGRDTAPGVSSVDRSVSEPTGERSRTPARPEPTSTMVETETETDTVVEDEPDAVFRTHVPQAATMPENIQPHREDLDEPLVMADVPLPEATYRPDLPPEAIESGMISDAQMLPIIYAGQAFEKFFNSTKGRVRAGFFTGDGTGVGKSHIIAGIILDNFRRGGKKAVWLGPSQNFFKDGERAWQLVAGQKKTVFKVNSTATHEPIKRKSGILFSTYQTLIGKSKKVKDATRLKQIQEWLGEDFDGVIAFDEAHYMKNAIPMKGKRGVQDSSKQAVAGMRLAELFPNARIVYASATGATEIVNMAYLDRLNLWGPETAFPSKEAFVASIADGGLAAMEIVARDMKAKGKYMRRQLSSRELTYEQIEHKMSPEQIDVYNNVADMWRETLMNLEAVNRTNETPGNQMQTFWNKHQDFFNRVLTSVSMPTLIPHIQQQIDAGNAVVLQITSTNEATLQRKMADREEDETLEDVELSSKEILENFLRENFPVEAYETVEDADGNESQQVVRDEETGDAVIDREAAARRDALLEKLFDLEVPEGALDQIVQRFGESEVAEVTSRKDRIVEDEDGNRAVQRRPSSQSEVDAFMDDKKQILIFSQAGATGASYHADNKRENKRKRIHILVEPGWQADLSIQGLGRTHRTDQAHKPHYVFVQTEVPGQRRFVASVIRKFDQVGALTGGERRTTAGGLLSPEDNIDNEYGERAVRRLIRPVGQGRKTLRIPGYDGGEEIEIGLAGLEQLLGKRMRNKDGKFTTSKIPDIRQFLNRVLGMRIDQQRVMYEYFEEELRGVIEQAIEDNEFDFGTEMISHDGAESVSSQSIYHDEETNTDTNLETIKVRETVKKEELDQFRGLQTLLRFVRTDRGRIWAEKEHRSRIDEQGRSTPMVMRIGPTSQRPMPRYESDGALREGRTTEIAREVTPEVEAAWQEESDRSPGYEERFIYLVTGALLPIWDKLPNPNNPTVYRIRLDDGTTRLGRVMGEDDLPKIEQNFSVKLEEGAITQVDRQYKTAEDVMGAVVDNGLRLELANRWVLRMSVIDRAERFEVEGVGHLDIEQVESMGITRIRQRSRNRYVIHFDGREQEVIQRLIERYPVVAEVEGRRRKSTGEPPPDTPQETPDTPPESSTPPTTPESSPAPIEGASAQEQETTEAPEISRRDVENAAAGLNVGTASTPEVLEQIYGRLNTEQMQGAGRSGVLWTAEQKPGIIAQIRDIQLQRTGEGVQELQQAQQESVEGSGLLPYEAESTFDMLSWLKMADRQRGTYGPTVQSRLKRTRFKREDDPSFRRFRLEDFYDRPTPYDVTIDVRYRGEGARRTWEVTIKPEGYQEITRYIQGSQMPRNTAKSHTLAVDLALGAITQLQREGEPAATTTAQPTPDTPSASPAPNQGASWERITFEKPMNDGTTQTVEAYRGDWLDRDPDFKGLKLVLHRMYEDSWTISELTTGKRLMPPSWRGGHSNKTRQGAIAILAEAFRNFTPRQWQEIQEQLNYPLTGIEAEQTQETPPETPEPTEEVQITREQVEEAVAVNSGIDFQTDDQTIDNLFQTISIRQLQTRGGRLWSQEEQPAIREQIRTIQQERAAEQEAEAEPPSEEAATPEPQPDTAEISDEVAMRFWRMTLAREANAFIDRRGAALSRDEGIAKAKEILGEIKAIPLEQRRQMVMADSWQRQGRSGRFDLVQDSEHNGMISITASRATVTLRNPSIQGVSVRAPGPNYGERFNAVLNELQSYLMMPESLDNRVSGQGKIIEQETSTGEQPQERESDTVTDATVEESGWGHHKVRSGQIPVERGGTHEQYTENLRRAALREVALRRKGRTLGNQRTKDYLDPDQWERQGQSGVFTHWAGGEITLDSNSTIAIFVIAGIGRFQREVSGANHQAKFESALTELEQMLIDPDKQQWDADRKRLEDIAEAEEGDEFLDATGTPTEIRVKTEGGVPQPTFEEEMSEDAENATLYHEDIDMGYEALQEAVMAHPEYDIFPDIAQASYVRRRAEGWERVEMTEAATIIDEVMTDAFAGDRSEDAYQRFADFIHHYARGVKALEPEEQLSFVEMPTVDEMLINALRSTSDVASAHIDPDSGRLRDWTVTPGDPREAGVRQLRRRARDVEVVPFTEQEPTPQERPTKRERGEAKRAASKGTIGKPQNKQERNQARIFDQQVHGLIEEITDPAVQVKTLGIYANIKAGEEVPIEGHKLDSAVEAAILMQVYRTPFAEKTWVFYLDDNDTVLDYKGWTLNRTDETTVGPISVIEADMERLGASRFLRLHNHPSTIARFSDSDKAQSQKWRDRFGERFVQDVIINSGTYAEVVYDSQNRPTYNEEIELPSERVGWDTSLQPLPTGIRPDDPLYKGAQPEAIKRFQETLPWGRGLTDEASRASFGELWKESGRARAAHKGSLAVAQVGRELKTGENAITLMFVNPNGYIVAAREYYGLERKQGDEIKDYIEEEAEKWGGHTVHVLVDKGDWYNTRAEAAERLRSLAGVSDRTASGGIYQREPTPYSHYASGIASVWIDGRPMLKQAGGESVGAGRNSIKGFRRNLPHVQQIHPLIDEAYQPEGSIADSDILRDVVNDIPKVVREAVVKLPRQAVETVGKSKRGTKKGADYIRQTFISWYPILAERIGAWTPRLRQAFRVAKSEFQSGIGNLYKMGAPGRELLEALRGRVRVANYLTNMFRADFKPLMVEFEKFSRDRHREAGGEESLVDVRGLMEEKIWRFIEDNEQIVGDAELAKIAVKWKDAWRDMLKTNIKLMISLQTSLEKQGQSLDIIDSKRQRKAWRPIMPEYGWSAKRKMFTKGRGKNIKYFTIDEALHPDNSTKLWTPHIYTPDHWQNRIEEAEALTAELDALSADENNIPGFQYISNRADPDEPAVWIWQAGRERRQFTERDKALVFAKRQAFRSRARAADMKKALLEGHAREGHMEMARETNDQFYERRLGLLQYMQMRFADRMGELHVFGQYDPDKENHGGSPYLMQYLKNIREYAENPEEHALREFVRPLLAHGKFKDMKGWQVSKQSEALEDLRRWEMDTILQESDRPSREARPGAWSEMEGSGGIDPNRIMTDNPDLTDDMKATLVRMGLLRQNQDGSFRMRSRSATARILSEYMDTIALRENTAIRIVNGLAPRSNFDPVELQGTEFWRSVNDATTITTLGVTASVQNVFEMPIVTLMTGSKAMARGTRDFFADPDFQEAGEFLGSAIGTTREYLAEGGQHAFTWLRYIGFNKTDYLGRGAGTVAGFYRAVDDIRAYLQNPSDINRGQLEDLQLNLDVIDGYIEEGGTVERFDRIIEEVKSRYKEGLVPVEGIRIREGDAAMDEYTDIFGDEIGKAAAFISDSAFKQYNALSLNSTLASRDPRLRMFLKYQAWAYQQSSLIYRQTRQAFKRAMQGDFRATWFLVATMGSLVGGYTAMRWVYDILQGREDKEVQDRLIDAFGESMAGGYISTLMEIARRAQGSAYSAMNSLMYLLSPAAGTYFARPFSELLAGDAGEFFREGVKQAPGVRELRRFGGRILPDDWR